MPKFSFQTEGTFGPHPDSDPTPQKWQVNGHKVAPKRHVFFYEPKDGRHELRLLMPAINKYGETLLPIRIVGNEDDYDLAFRPGNKVVVAETNLQLLHFIRGNIPRWFRKATVYDLNKE